MVLNSLQTWLHRAHNLFNLPSLKWFLVKCCGINCFTKLHGVDTEIHSVKTPFVTAVVHTKIIPGIVKVVLVIVKVVLGIVKVVQGIVNVVLVITLAKREGNKTIIGMGKF